MVATENRIPAFCTKKKRNISCTRKKEKKNLSYLLAKRENPEQVANWWFVQPDTLLRHSSGVGVVPLQQHLPYLHYLGPLGAAYASSSTMLPRICCPPPPAGSTWLRQRTKEPAD